MFKQYLQAMALLLTVTTAGVAWGGADPTRPPGFGERQAKKNHFTLNSVLVSDGRRVAIINGKPVTEGESVDGAKVLTISQAVVKLNQRGNILILKPKRVSIRREK